MTNPHLHTTIPPTIPPVVELSQPASAQFGSSQSQCDRTSEMNDRIRSLVWKMAIATLLLMAIGSATRVMNAGLACPDWPLCYGTLFPQQQMNLQVFLEWFHRLDAALIGCMAIALVVASIWHRRVLPRWLPGLSILALGLIVFQGILGGLTVTQLLRFDIVTAHLGTALLFFATLLVTAILLTPRLDMALIVEASVGQSIGEDLVAQFETQLVPLNRLKWISLIAVLLTYGQSLTGALVGSQWALHQCLFGAQLCSVMNAHLMGVLPATIGSLAVAIATWRSSHLPRLFHQLSRLTVVLLMVQILLGIATFRLHLQVELITICHQAIAAMLLGTLICDCTLAFTNSAHYLFISRGSMRITN